MSRPKVNMRKRAKRGRRNQKLAPWTAWEAMTRVTHPRYAWPEHADRAWVNNRFIVIGCPYTFGREPGLLLMIQRCDGRPGITWAEKQKIKNQLVGPEAAAFECYPRESELVNSYNVYHLWATKHPLPGGFDKGVSWVYRDPAGDNAAGAAKPRIPG
jgi:hypothetical protein